MQNNKPSKNETSVVRALESLAGFDPFNLLTDDLDPRSNKLVTTKLPTSRIGEVTIDQANPITPARELAGKVVKVTDPLSQPKVATTSKELEDSSTVLEEEVSNPTKRSKKKKNKNG